METEIKLQVTYCFRKGNRKIKTGLDAYVIDMGTDNSPHEKMFSEEKIEYRETTLNFIEKTYFEIILTRRLNTQETLVSFANVPEENLLEERVYQEIIDETERRLNMRVNGGT